MSLAYHFKLIRIYKEIRTIEVNAFNMTNPIICECHLKL